MKGATPRELRLIIAARRSRCLAHQIAKQTHCLESVVAKSLNVLQHRIGIDTVRQSHAAFAVISAQQFKAQAAPDKA